MNRILLLLGLAATFSCVDAQTTLINQNFEAAVGATLANNATNQWHRGTAAAQAGNFGLYISNNSGTSNAYTITTTQVSHAYWTVNFPAGETDITLSFNWRGFGEGCCDYLRVYTQTTNPTAGNLPTGTLHATYNGQATWQTVNLTLPGSLAGTNNVRVIFTWRNDGSVGTQPPAAIDNVVLTTAVPPAPANDNCAGAINLTPGVGCTYTAGTTNGATQSLAGCTGNADDDVWYRFTATSTFHNVTVQGSASFDAVVQAFNACGGAAVGACTNATVAGGTENLALTGLTPGTQYFVRVYHSGAGSSATPTFNICVSTPPPGATCGNPILVNSYPYTHSASSAGMGNDIGTQTSTCSSLYGGGDDVIYQIDITTAGNYDITLTNTSASGYIGWFLKSSANCMTTGSSLSCAVSGSANVAAGTYNFAAGTYFLILDYWPSPTNSNYTLNIAPSAPPPSNDNCAGSIALTPGGTCTYTAGTSASATQTFAGCSGTADDDVWYHFVASATTHVINVQGGASYDAVVQVYSGSCGGTSLACANLTGAGALESAVVSGLTVGATYWVRTFHSGAGSSATPTFNICVTVPPPGATCGNPIVVSSYPYSNTNTTCGSFNDYGTQCSSLYGGGEDLVYELNITTTGVYTFGLSGTLGYSGMFLKSAANCTNAASCLAFDATSATSQGFTYNFTTAGTYYLIIDTWPSPNCTGFTLNISAPSAPPSNDNCAGSILLTSGIGCTYTAGTSAGASQTFAGCSGTADDDVWYHFVATYTTHVVQVQGGASYDAVVQVYSGSCGGTSITCTNLNGTGLMETVSISGLTVGATYWVRVFHWGAGASATPTFNICVTDPPPGNTCATPVVVNTYPYSITSTTLGLTNNYGSQSCNTSYGGGNDAVFQLNITNPGPYSIDLTNTSGTGYIGWFLATTCGNTGAANSLACQVSGWGNNAASTFNFSAAGTYYLIIDYFPSPTNSNYTLNIIPLVCPSGLGPIVSVPSLPYTSSGRTTCGQGNELTTATASTCGSNLYFTDMDEIFSFTPTSSGLITVNLTTASTNTGLALYHGCPFSGTCVGFSQSGTGSKTMCATVAAGETYYLIVDSYLTGGGCIGSYTIDITAPGATPSCVSGLGTGVVNIASLPYSAASQTTCGQVNDLTSSNTQICGSASYYSAEDRVYVFTPTASGISTITLTSASSFVGLALYAGCPLADACYGGGGTCVAQEQSSSGSQTLVACLQAGQTYYLLVDQWASPTCIPSYSISITAPISGVGALNDLPCSALELPMGIFVGGTNACASGVGEPGVPSCWSGGTLNTVWYRFVAPSTNVKLRTILYSLTNTQIAVYSGTCTALSLIACNQNAPDCGWTSVLNSELNLTGLTAGATYFVRVDGVNDLKGNFSIVAIDGAASFPPVNGQDCPSPVPVCSPVTAVGDPGYQAIGSDCDHTGDGNCTTGERGSAWYQITIANPGALNFTIRPNDGVSDYDYVLWKVAGAGATSCANIAASGGGSVVSCNYSALGTTGVYTGGNTPPPYSGFDGAFEPTVNVAAGEVYLLVVQNFANSTSGFSLDFGHSGATVVNYTAPTTVYWSGTVSTAWDNPLNWGGCSVPDCNKNAVILPGAANQPVIDGGISASVKDLTISPGATLTIVAGHELQVCGHYTNTGYLYADPGSTVRMVGSLNPQNMTGYMTTFSKFDNLIIDKSGVGDNVYLYADLETGGAFTITRGNFRVNGNDHFAGGDFTVNSTGIYTPGTGRTHFNGAGTQTFTNNGSCVFNHVLMVKSAANAVVLNHNMVLNGTANLTLTNGWITTGANRVIVNNPAVGSVTQGNSNSYVRGNLRRYVNTTGAYNLPVGNASKGYQRININFTTAHGGGGGGGYNYLDASFSDGPLGGAVLGQHECGNNGYDVWLYDGYWTVTGARTDMSAVTNPGVYTAIGFPTSYPGTFNSYNYANVTGNASATLAKGPVFSSLALEGDCMYNSSPSSGVGRIGLSGFSDFGIAVDVSNPFPVEMSPLEAEPMTGFIRLNWATASEVNNRGFEVQRSTNATDFASIGWKDGVGNSSALQNYAFDDRTAKPGVKYHYRLRQVDFDGGARYSNVATAVLSETVDELSLSVYPNPTDGAFVLSVASPESRKLTIDVYDLAGRRVMQTSAKAEAGTTDLPLTLNGLAAGAYQLKVNDGEKTHTVRIQKK